MKNAHDHSLDGNYFGENPQRGFHLARRVFMCCLGNRRRMLLRWMLGFAMALGLALGMGCFASAAESFTLTAAGDLPGIVRIEAKGAKAVSSKDDYLYLFEVNPADGKLVKQIGKASKETSVTFSLSMEEDPAYPMLMYALAVKTGSDDKVSSFTRVSNASYVRNPEKAAMNQDPYIYPATKKGMQSGSYDIQKDTDSKNCFVNITVSSLLNSPNITYTYNGKSYRFNSLYGLQVAVRNCNKDGILVTAQVMLDANAPASYRQVKGGSAPYYAFNIKDQESRQTIDALFMHLARFFGREDCFISNWILGNEVNSTSPYYYMGDVSESTFAKTYATTFRSLYNAVRSVRANSRVFTCLEHCWSTENGYDVCFSGKSFLSAFHSALQTIQPDVRWNLAYHPYPYYLEEPAFWNDNVTDSASTDVISMKNIGVLTSYMKKKYGDQTRIIVSEIGFNSQAGEKVQAAALALGYDIAACDPGIDAFIIRSYQDEAGDAAYGLTFGIKGKKAYDVFKYMDTESYADYTTSLLKKQVGSDWKDYVPGFEGSRLYTMYSDGVTTPPDPVPEVPSSTPTPLPTNTPTSTPSPVPTSTPTSTPTPLPTEEPTNTPAPVLTEEPIEAPADTPTPMPTEELLDTPTPIPTQDPIEEPLDTPAPLPTEVPTLTPTPTPEPPSTPEPLSAPSVGAVLEGPDGNLYQVTAVASEVAFFKANVMLKALIIPDTVELDGITYKVTSIARDAGRGNTRIKSVVIGSNVVTIGQSAFNGCSKITKITMGEHVQVISPAAFQKCLKLGSITLPRNVISIGKNAFIGCKKLKTIKIQTAELTFSSIGKNAFKSIYSKVKVTVPAGKKAEYKVLLNSRGLPSGAKVK